MTEIQFAWLLRLIVFGLIGYGVYSCAPSTREPSATPYVVSDQERREIAQLARKRELQAALDKLADMEADRQRKLEAAIKHWEGQLIEDYRACVDHGLMTPDQFKAITGQPYSKPVSGVTTNPFAR